MSIIGVHHVGISVPDLEAAAAFYSDALGFRLITTESWDASAVADAVTGLHDSAARAVCLWTGTTMLELFQFERPIGATQQPDRPVCDHGFNHLCLEVDDIHDAVARLSAHGMRFHCEPVGDQTGWFTYGRDPFGNVIELVQVDDPARPHMRGWEFTTLPERTYQ